MSRFSRINNIVSLASSSTGININLTISESSSDDFDDSDADCDYIPCQTQEYTDTENENLELLYHTLQPAEVPFTNNTIYSENDVDEPDDIHQMVYDDNPQTTNDNLDNLETIIGNQVETPLRRWNKKNPEGSIRAIHKKKRNLGLEYTVGNKKFPEKFPKPISYCDKCKFDCLSFTEEERNEICRNYWGLVDFQRKKDFIISRLLISEPNRRRPRQLNAKCRTESRKYFFLKIVKNGVEARLG